MEIWLEMVKQVLFPLWVWPDLSWRKRTRHGNQTKLGKHPRNMWSQEKAKSGKLSKKEQRGAHRTTTGEWARRPGKESEWTGRMLWTAWTTRNGRPGLTCPKGSMGPRERFIQSPRPLWICSSSVVSITLTRTWPYQALPDLAMEHPPPLLAESGSHSCPPLHQPVLPQFVHGPCSVWGTALPDRFLLATQGPPCRGSWSHFAASHIPTVPSIQFSSVAQPCVTLCNPMNCSSPGLPVHHQLPEFAQTHVHRVSDAIQPSHPLSSPSPPALNLSQHQGLFQ